MGRAAGSWRASRTGLESSPSVHVCYFLREILFSCWRVAFWSKLCWELNDGWGKVKTGNRYSLRIEVGVGCVDGFEWEFFGGSFILECVRYVRKLLQVDTSVVVVDSNVVDREEMWLGDRGFPKCLSLSDMKWCTRVEDL